MNRYNQAKHNFYFIIVMLLILGIGIGYAVLSERLTIDNTISYDSMKWDIGFTATSDNGGSVTSIPSISSNKKSITISCNLGTSTKSETCIAKATITNGSTFNIMLSEAPTITYDDTYISSVDVMWVKSFESPKQLDGINAGNSEDIQIKVTTKEIDESMLPEETLSISVTFTMNWIEADGNENVVVSIVGQEITLGEEKFNVISATKTTVTMLAQYNLGTDYRQTTTENYVTFSDESGWEYTPGPKEIDIQTWSTYPKTYVNEYVKYLSGVTGDASLIGDLITLNELKLLGCTINDDYSGTSALGCLSSSYYSWLVNEQLWWTRSAGSTGYYSDGNIVWVVLSKSFSGGLNTGEITGSYGPTGGIRPVITISKETLEKSIISFKIGDDTYYAEEGMTWGEWVNSGFNTNTELQIVEFNGSARINVGSNGNSQSSWLFSGIFVQLADTVIKSDCAYHKGYREGGSSN